MSAPRTLLLWDGRFGERVAERMARTEPAQTVAAFRTASADLGALLDEADFVAVALWRREAAALDALGRLCMARAIPWSSATFDGRRLLLGPVVRGGAGPCYTCFGKRWATHLGAPENDRAVDALYRADPVSGVPGFPPGAASVAAAALAFDRADVLAGAAGGRLRLVDLLHGRLEETRVVRVHGCAVCGESGTQGSRYVRHLRAALPALSA